LDYIKELFEAGKLVCVIDKVYPLNEVPEAPRYFGDGYVKGKVIITMEHNQKSNKAS
jgi:NADPH:quinone reductase-like Zn-dependent oxidoreductase